MKIALFSDTFAPQINGVANTVKNSARVLGEMGHEVRVYTLSKKKAGELTEESLGAFTVVTLPSSAIPAYPGERLYLPIGFALKNLYNFKPDIIHLHTPFAVGFEGVLGGRLFGIPVVGTHHTFFDHYLKHVYLDYKWARNFSWSATVAFYNRTDLVLSPTKSLRNELLSHGLKKPVEVLSNSINFQIFQNDAKLKTVSKIKLKKKLDIPEKAIVYMGRVSYEKSIDEVLRAVALIVKKIPNLRFLIIGDGPEKEKLMALCKELEIENNVIFTGFVHGQSLVEALSAGDAFVTASKSENMPLAVLEAMSVGLPIITVSSLGMTEIVEDNGNGFLLEHGRSDETAERIAEAVLRLFTDDKLRKKLSMRSLELSKKYSEKKINTRLVEIYQKVINSKKKNKK